MSSVKKASPWDGIISEDEKKAYRAAGFGRPTGIGKRPALLIIDVQYRTTGTKPMPFCSPWTMPRPTVRSSTAWASARP